MYRAAGPDWVPAGPSLSVQVVPTAPAATVAAAAQSENRTLVILAVVVVLALGVAAGVAAWVQQKKGG
jgi:uncharacterized protein HemX